MPPRSSLAVALAVILMLSGQAAAAQTPAIRPLTLEQAIDLAASQGFQAEAAKATRDAARFRDRAFYSGLLPQLRLDGTVPQYNRAIIQAPQPDGSTQFRTQNQTNAELRATLSQRLPITGGDIWFSSSLARLNVSGAQSIRTWSSTPFVVGIRQPIFRPNLLAWDRREQPVRSELAERQYREAREDIAVQTTALFYDAYAARVTLDNAGKNAAVNDTLYTLNQGRFQVGKIGENDLLQSELALLRARTSLDGAKLEYDRAMAALRLAMNLPPNTPFEVAVTTVVPAVEADTARAVAEALRNRATVTDAELQQVQAERRVTEARLNNGVGGFVNARFGYNATAPDVSLVYSNLLEARQFSVGVELPILQWGARKEGVQAAQADRKRVTSIARSTQEQVAQEAHFAVLQLAQARRNLALSAKADTVAGKRFEVAYNRYVIGKIALDNLFLAQAEKDQALQQFVQALRGYWTAFYRLRRVTLFDFVLGHEIE
jgi:outer membrane protein TolC